MKHKVLVVDDAPEVCELIQEGLQGEGFHVATARDGLDALEKVKADRPDLIIVDILMPKMDGFTFYKELKGNQDSSNIPVLVLTVRSKMEETFRSMGVGAFLSKPLDAHALLAEVKRLVGGWPGNMQEEQSPSPDFSRASVQNVPPAVDQTGLKNIFLFANDEDFIKEFSSQMAEAQYATSSIRREEEIVPAFNRTSPDVVLVQLNGHFANPADEIIGMIDVLLRHQVRKQVPLLLFKLPESHEAGAALAANVIDEDNLVARCYDQGCTKYLGEYSHLTFLLKIQEFIS